MHKITRQELADNVAERWAKQYPPEQWPDKQDIARALKALPSGTPHDIVDAIIGNTAWTDLSCDECGKYDVDFVIQVGQELDYESRKANICGTCIEKLQSL